MSWTITTADSATAELSSPLPKFTNALQQPAPPAQTSGNQLANFPNGNAGVGHYSYGYDSGYIYLSNSGSNYRGLAFEPQPQTQAGWFSRTWPWGATGDEKQKIVKEPSREMLKRVAVEADAVDLTDEDRKLAVEAETWLGYQPLRKALHVAGLLRRVLAKLEIEVLDQESVDAYKAQMVEHYRSSNKLPMPTWRLVPLAQYTQEVPKFALRKAVDIKRELPEARLYVDQLAIDPFLIVSMTELPDPPHNCKRGLDPETAAYVEVWSEPKFEATM